MRRAGIFVATLLAVACEHEGDRPFVAPAPAIHADAQQGSDQDFVAVATAPRDARPDEVGLATWYGAQFAGKKTANGERFDPAALTAAPELRMSRQVHWDLLLLNLRQAARGLWANKLRTCLSALGIIIGSIIIGVSLIIAAAIGPS